MKKKLVVAVLASVFLIGMFAGGYFYYSKQTDLVYSEVYIEAGSTECSVKDFLKREEDSAKFTDDSTFDLNVAGDYPLIITCDLPVFGQKQFKTTLHVQDTIAPEISLSVDSIDMYTTAPAPTAADLVEAVYDASNCVIDYKQEYDFSKEGSFDVTVVVTDGTGNSSEATVPCKVVADVTPPEITGVEPLTFSQGDAISYKKNIVVTDDIDDNPTLEVDTSEVNADKRGVYPIKYIATDSAGNVTEKSTSVKIVSAKIAEATEETVNAMADEILAEIISEDMSQKEQDRAVYNWVADNITYSESAGIDDLYSAAYKGMHNRIGDCTVKQKTAEVMLNRLGIKNMEIEKIRDTRGHYWLLIDIGEGWYHYDPNLQLDGTRIFYWHDADLWEYSNSHKNTHNYDPSKYPTIQ